MSFENFVIMKRKHYRIKRIICESIFIFYDGYDVVTQKHSTKFQTKSCLITGFNTLVKLNFYADIAINTTSV
jgi:hypothetical protein